MAHSELNKPLNINLLKEIIREASKKLDKIKIDHSEELFTLALALTAAVKKTLHERSGLKFSCEPIIKKRGIVQFVKRLRIDALEKFNQATVFSVIHYYINKKYEEKNIPCGVLIMYIEKKATPEVLRLFQYPYIDYDDESEVKDGCGALINLIAGQFKREMSLLGYQDLEMSYFNSYINTVPNGIDFPNAQEQKYEMSFHIEGIKRIVIEMVMSDLKKGTT